MKCSTFVYCLASLAIVVAAPVRAAEVDKAAGDACEKQVTETVRELRGREAQDVQFTGVRRAVPQTGDTDESSVRGEGRYKGGSTQIAFTYSCSYNAATGVASGVVLSEKGRPAAEAEAARVPDISTLSPEACERATASALKDKYPRVGRIVFGSDSRRVEAAPNERTSLEGLGGVERAPGMNAIPFRYRCEFEARSGKLVSVRTSEGG